MFLESYDSVIENYLFYAIYWSWYIFIVEQSYSYFSILFRLAVLPNLPLFQHWNSPKVLIKLRWL